MAKKKNMVAANRAATGGEIPKNYSADAKQGFELKSIPKDAAERVLKKLAAHFEGARGSSMKEIALSELPAMGWQIGSRGVRLTDDLLLVELVRAIGSARIAFGAFAYSQARRVGRIVRRGYRDLVDVCERSDNAVAVRARREKPVSESPDPLLTQQAVTTRGGTVEEKLRAAWFETIKLPLGRIQEHLSRLDMKTQGQVRPCDLRYLGYQFTGRLLDLGTGHDVLEVADEDTHRPVSFCLLRCQKINMGIVVPHSYDAVVHGSES